MVYEPQSLRCPYQGRENKNCSHKGCAKVCTYIHKQEKCDKYIEWLKLKKFNTELDLEEAMKTLG